MYMFFFFDKNMITFDYCCLREEWSRVLGNSQVRVAKNERNQGGGKINRFQRDKSILCEGVFVQRRRRRQKRVIGKLLEFSRTISFARVSSGVTLEGDEEERDGRHAGGRGGRI